MTISQKDILHLQERLLTEKKEIEEQLKKVGSPLEFGDDIDHLEEESDATEEIGNRLSIQKTFEGNLKRINSALEKIKKGGYGICERCKKDITVKLLEVDPESRYCQECKKLMRG